MMSKDESGTALFKDLFQNEETKSEHLSGDELLQELPENHRPAPRKRGGWELRPKAASAECPHYMTIPGEGAVSGRPSRSRFSFEKEAERPDQPAIMPTNENDFSAEPRSSSQFTLVALFILNALVLLFLAAYAASGYTVRERKLLGAPAESVASRSIKSAPSIFDDEPLDHQIRFKGETLSFLAGWYTGNAENWKLILEANPDLDLKRLKLNQHVSFPRKLLVRTAPPSQTDVEAGLKNLSPAPAESLQKLPK